MPIMTHLHLSLTAASCSHSETVFLTEAFKTTLSLISTLSNAQHPNIQKTSLGHHYSKGQVSVSGITTWAENISNAAHEEDPCLHDATKNKTKQQTKGSKQRTKYTITLLMCQEKHLLLMPLFQRSYLELWALEAANEGQNRTVLKMLSFPLLSTHFSCT